MSLQNVALENGTDHNHVVSISIFVALLCLCIVVGHLLEENRWVNESITALLIGCFTGFIILLWSKGKSSHILRFDEELFFIYLLPPIIFNAGFQVKKKQFFRNFFTIMLLGAVGVFISFAIISAGCWWLFPKIGFVGLRVRDYFALGTIFSSTDTVCTLQVLNQDETPLLYSLVFGEGVVNDATSVVLFRTVQKLDVSRLDLRVALYTFKDFLYLFATSTSLGIVSGLLTAYVIKALYFGRHSTDREIALMILMAYLSYMLAEDAVLGHPPSLGFIFTACFKNIWLMSLPLWIASLLHLSGILTVFFCGIVMSHYAWHNVTENSRITTRHVFATMSFISETFIFLYVGMDALDIEKWRMKKSSFKTSIEICSSVLGLILLGRAAFVFPLCVLANYVTGKAESPKLTFKRQVVIWWAGLMRGAVSIALAFNQFTYSGVTWDPVHATMITTTIIVVLFSMMVFGFLTRPLIDILLPHHKKSNHQTSPPSPKEELSLPLISVEDSGGHHVLRRRSSLSMLLERPAHTIHFYWRKFDDAYMRPIFGGPG